MQDNFLTTPQQLQQRVQFLLEQQQINTLNLTDEQFKNAVTETIDQAIGELSEEISYHQCKSYR